MSKYTTGEIAKLCGVSVRTVQYYDSRNILVPSELSEGGRRLYSEDDLKRMRIICFLREAGVPINSIGELFAEEHPEAVAIFLQEYEVSIDTMLSDVEGTSVKIQENGIFAKAPVAAKAIPNCNVCFITGAEMQASLSEFLTIMHGVAPASVGGAIPGDDFYCILD